MRFILVYPEAQSVEGDLLDAGDVGEVAALAEAAGFDGLALTEHPAPGLNWLSSGGHQTLDPLVGLAFAAAATQHIDLLTYLVVLPYRNPFVLAKAAATLDRLSGGRLVLGVGTGYLKSEFYAVGVDMEERNALFDEAMEAMPLAWSGKPFNFTGRHFEARNVICRPPAAQQPIPVWIGGNSKLTLRRIAATAQGWIPVSGSPELANTTRTPHLEGVENIGAATRALRQAAADNGRTEHITVTPSYPDASILQADQDVERHRELIGRYEEIGVDNLTIDVPAWSAPALRDFIAAFGEHYIG
jgi:probable F420-dependent oxidoreductase